MSWGASGRARRSSAVQTLARGVPLLTSGALTVDRPIHVGCVVHDGRVTKSCGCEPSQSENPSENPSVDRTPQQLVRSYAPVACVRGTTRRLPSRRPRGNPLTAPRYLVRAHEASCCCCANALRPPYPHALASYHAHAPPPHARSPPHAASSSCSPSRCGSLITVAPRRATPLRTPTRSNRRNGTFRIRPW